MTMVIAGSRAYGAMRHHYFDRAMADEAALPRPKRSRQALEVAHDSPHDFFLIDECNPVPENQCCSAGEEERSKSWVHQPSDPGLFPTPARSASSTYSTEMSPLPGGGSPAPATIATNSSPSMPQSQARALLRENLPYASNSEDGRINIQNPESSKSLHFDNECSAVVFHAMKDLLPKSEDTNAKTDGQMRVVELLENPEVTFGGWGDKSSSNVITAFPMYQERALHKLSTAGNTNRNVPTLTEQRMKGGSPYKRGSPVQMPVFGGNTRRKGTRRKIRFLLPGEDGAQLSRENLAAKSSPRVSRPRSMSRSRRQRSPLPGSRQCDVALEATEMRYVSNIVDNLVKEFEQRPILKPLPPQTPRSLSVSRVSPGRWRRNSASRSISSPLYGYKERRLQLPHGRRSASPLQGNVALAFHSASESESSSGSGKELEGISTVCSLLESITGDVKTEAQRLHMPEARLPAFLEEDGSGGFKEYLRRKTKTSDFTVKRKSSRRRRYTRRPWARKERSQRDDRSLKPSIDGHHQRQLRERMLAVESYSAGTEMDATGTSISDMTFQSSTDAEDTSKAREKVSHYTKGPKKKKVLFLTNFALRNRKSEGDRLSKPELKQVKDNTGSQSETADAASSSSSSGSSKYLPHDNMSDCTQGSTGKVDQPTEISQVESFGNSSQGNKYLQNSRKLHYKKDERRHSPDPEQKSSTESSLCFGDYFEQVAVRKSRSTIDDSTSQRSERMQKPHQMDKPSWASLVEPVAQNLALFRERIGRRSSTRLAKGRPICGTENNASTGPLAQTARAAGTDNSGKSRPGTLVDIAGSSHALTDTLASTPMPIRPSWSDSIGIGLLQEWSTAPNEASAPVSISAVARHTPRSEFTPKSRKREPTPAQPIGSCWRFPEMSPTMQLMSPVSVSVSHLIGQDAAMQAKAPSELASSNRQQSTPPVYMEPEHDRPGERKLSATRLSTAPYGKQHSAYKGSGATKLPSELLQPEIFSSTRIAPSRVSSTSCGASFVTALNAAGTGLDFDRTTAETSPAQLMAPTVASTTGSLALFQPQDPPILPQSRRSQSNTPDRPRVPSLVEDESSYALKSGQMTPSTTVSDTKARSRYNMYGPVRRSSSLHQYDPGNTLLRGDSTGLIMPRGLSEPHEGYMKNFRRSGCTVLYIILAAGTLAGIIAGLSLHMNSSASLEFTQDVGEADNVAQSPMYSPLFEREFGLAYKPPSCHNPSCSEMVARLVRSLDASVHPCRNFYKHVCSLRQVESTADDQLVQSIESKVIAFFKGIGSPDRDLPVAAASRRLWKDCVDLTTLNRLGKAPLQTLLKLNGLSEWPYVAGNGGSGALPDIWKTAGLLLRRMALSPLVGVSVTNSGTVQLIRGDVDSGSREADDVLDAMLMLRPDSSRLRKVAADVAALARDLSGLLDRQPPPVSPDDEKHLVPFLETAVNGLGFIDAGIVHAYPASFLGPLLEVLHRTEPQTVLNLLGYRLVRHVDLFTPSAVKADLDSGAVSGRESQCAHTVLEAALTGDEAEYVRYSALRNQLDFDLVRSMLEQLKHALVAKLPGLQRWVDTNTFRETQRRLRELKVRFLFDRYERDTQMFWSKPPVALPSQALLTYQRFREARFRGRLTKRSAVEDVGDQHCTYDADHEALYVRLSVVDTRDPDSPLWPVLQVARMGPRVSRCLLDLLLPPSEHGVRRPQMVNWSSAEHARLGMLRTCFQSQQIRDNPAGQPLAASRDEIALADLGALGPSKEVFETYVTHIAAMSRETMATESEDTKTLSWDQVFYTAYAHSMCENHPGHLQRSAQRVPRWARVNMQLANDQGFLRAFQCRRGDHMHPDTTCHFWGPSQ